MNTGSKVIDTFQIVGFAASTGVAIAFLIVQVDPVQSVEIGLDLAALLKVTVILRNISDFDAMHEVWKSIFPAAYPARTTTTSDFVDEKCLIQVEGIASMDNGGRVTRRGKRFSKKRSGMQRRIIMPKRIRTFWSPEMEARFNAAYKAVLELWPVPYEELYIPTRFGDTHVIASGPKDAAPLVLLHGAGGGATIWYRNVEAFSRRYRTYAVDVIGDMNKSILTRPMRTHRDLAAWIEDLFNGLHIESAYMVGNSYGGYLTFNTVLYLPERVRKVVLISPAATFVQIWPIYWHTIIPGHWIAPILRSRRLVWEANSWIWQGFPMDERVARLRRIAEVAGHPRYRPTHNPLPTVFSDEELREIFTPVLLLIGDHEVIYNPERVIERTTRLVHGLKAEIVPNANHVAEYTSPDLINEKILEFLRDCEPEMEDAGSEANREAVLSVTQ